MGIELPVWPKQMQAGWRPRHGGGWLSQRLPGVPSRVSPRAGPPLLNLPQPDGGERKAKPHAVGDLAAQIFCQDCPPKRSRQRCPPRWITCVSFPQGDRLSRSGP
jgi:hypothetical protein